MFVLNITLIGKDFTVTSRKSMLFQESHKISALRGHGMTIGNQYYIGMS